MPILSEDYVFLRNRVVDSGRQSNFSEEQLKNVILNFESIINSNRRIEYIRSLEDLIKILEKRGHLGEGKIENLERITQFLPNFEEMMTQYQATRTTRHRPGMYSSSQVGGSTALPIYSIRSESSDTSTINNIDNVLPRAVVDRVVLDIGTNWRDLARALDIREGDIDNIECLHPRNLKERARECIKIFLRDTDPCKASYILQAALEECRRKDIKEQVAEILSRRQY